MKPVLNFQSTPSLPRLLRSHASSLSRRWVPISEPRSTSWRARLHQGAKVQVKRQGQFAAGCGEGPVLHILRREEQNIMIKKFLKDESGLELSEYAVAAALVALACVVAFQTLGTQIGARIDTLAGFIK